MIIDTVNKRAFIHVPKSGLTTLRDYFANKNGFIFISEAHEPFEYYQDSVIKHDVKEFVCFLRHPADWFLSYFAHSRLHNINRKKTLNGIDYFVKNFTNLYNEFIDKMCPENTIFYPLESMDKIISDMGYGQIKVHQNVTINFRNNTIEQKNFDVIMNHYNDEKWSNYKQISTIKERKEDVTHIGHYRYRIR